jgi:hypothetical protein
VNFATLDLSSIVGRLRDRATVLRMVGGAVDLEAARRNGLATDPAAFVMPARDRVGDSPYMDGVVSQKVAAEFAVVLAVKNVADATGEAALDALAPVRNSVGAALLAWTPDNADSHCEFVGGELATFGDGVLLWADSYRTSYTVRSI